MALKTKHVVYINHFYTVTILTNYRLTPFLLYVGHILYITTYCFIYIYKISRVICNIDCRAGMDFAVDRLKYIFNLRRITYELANPALSGPALRF